MCLTGTVPAEMLEHRWWPVQEVPAGISKTYFELFQTYPGKDGKEIQAGQGQEHMLAQSLAGLTAKAVNEGRLDEMVWVGIQGHKDYMRWERDVIARLKLEDRGTYTPWELLERYRDRGVYRGYLLYAYDQHRGNPMEFHPDAATAGNCFESTEPARYSGAVVASSTSEFKYTSSHV